MIITIFQHYNDTAGKQIEFDSFESCIELLSNRVITSTKESIPQWSPARFDGGGRKATNVIDISCLVYDVDDEPRKDFLQRFRSLNVRYFIYSTHSHGTKKPRAYRIILPLEEPLPPERWKPTWWGWSDNLGINADPASGTPNRMHFMPSCPKKGRRSSFFAWGGTRVAAEIKKPIQTPSRPRNKHVPEKIPDWLSKLDLSLVEKEGGWEIQDPCPVCLSDENSAPGAQPRTAFIFEDNRRLFCHRTKCPASSGIDFARWEKTVHTFEGIKENYTLDGITQKLQREIPRILREHTDTIRVVDVPPGVGKSYLTLREILRLGHGTFAAPTHKLLQEHVDTAKKLHGENLSYRYILGISAKDYSGAPYCRRLDVVEDVISRGLSPRQMVCKGVGSVGPCPYRHDCVAYRGWIDVGNVPQITFTTHAGLQRLHRSKDYTLEYPIVVDEMPTLIRNEVLDLNVVEELLSRAASEQKPAWCTFPLVQGLKRIQEGLAPLLSIPMNSPKIMDSDIEQNVLGFLQKAYEDGGLTLEVKDEKATLMVADQDWPPGMIVLDATAFAWISAGDKLFGQKIQHLPFDLKVPDPVKIEDPRWSRSALREMECVEIQDNFRQVLQRCDWEPPLAVITHKFLCEILRELTPEETVWMWFGGQRGLNSAAHCRTLLVLGAPWPNIGAAHREGTKLGVNPRSWIDALHDAELAQSIGRLRQVRDPSKKVFVIS